MSRSFTKVYGIEVNKTSFRFAKKNAAQLRTENVEFRNERVGEFLDKSDIEIIDFVLIDPPRSGVKRRTLEKIALLEARRICYVSCNPSTLARDLRILVDRGYRLEKITALDFFPQTHHVETVAHLSR